VSLSRDVIFKDESVINCQLVECSNNLNDSNKIDVLSLHKDGSLEHSNKSEGDEVMENEFGSIKKMTMKIKDISKEMDQKSMCTTCETEVILRNHYFMIIQPFS